MKFLKQSTAATLVMGPLVDSTDGVSAETGLTIAQASVRLSKAGGAFAQKNEATSASHMENGYYSVPVDATDTGTVGRLRVAAAIAGACPVWEDYTVLPALVYDSLIGGTDALQVDAIQWLGSGVTAGAIPAAAAGASGGLPTTNGTKINQTADLTAGQSIGVSGDFSATMKSSITTAVPTAADIAASVWASVIETGWTAVQSLRILLSAIVGKLSGGGTATETFRDVGDTKNRIVGTVDSNGNRTAITYTKD